jgi:hypothetical protein
MLLHKRCGIVFIVYRGFRFDVGCTLACASIFWIPKSFELQGEMEILSAEFIVG